MRALGIDVGERRIGVALSDELGLLAAPLTTVMVRGGDAALAELAAIARERAAEVVVVGLPKSLNGREGPQARAVRAFADRLAPLLDAPLELWDERLTTVEAERALIARGVKRQQRRARIDAAAAAIMLQDYLDAHRARRLR
jgi:putative Holliday junction resolvase